MNTDRRSLDILLNREIETLGLTPEEYRLYAHLVAAVHSPSIDPAKASGLTQEATELALAVLSGCGLVTSVQGFWVLCDKADWAGGMVEQVRAEALKIAAKAPEPEPEPVETPHQTFMRRWDEEFFKVNEYKYTFDGPRDGAAVKDLLKQGKTVDGMISLAIQAWNKVRSGGGRCWGCSQAVTIWGFKQRLNAIQMELKQGCLGSAPPSGVGSRVYGEHVEAKVL